MDKHNYCISNSVIVQIKQICLTAMFLLRPQVIKNLLFVGKAIYLISPESDASLPQEGVKEEEEEQQEENGDEEEGEEETEKELEEEEDENDKDDRPPSLLWLMKKLLLMAKREAAYTPKVPLKVF